MAPTNLNKKEVPLLHPPLKRKATKWRGCQNPPPITFAKSPPPNSGIHKLIHKNTVTGSAKIAEVKRLYKNVKYPRLPILQIPATKFECQIEIDTLTGRRTVKVDNVRCHRLFKGETKVYPGELLTDDNEIKKAGANGWLLRGHITDEARWVKRGTYQRMKHLSFTKVPQCPSKLLNELVHAVGRMDLGGDGADHGGA